jgi:hypothetical protein
VLKNYLKNAIIDANKNGRALLYKTELDRKETAMNKGAKIAIVIIYSMVVLMALVLIVGIAASVARYGFIGALEQALSERGLLVGTDSQAQEQPSLMQDITSGEQELETLPEQQELSLFDYEKTHKPLYEDYLKIAEDMPIIEAVAILGKPHYMDCAAGSRYLIWETVDGGEIMIRMRFPGYDGTQILDINTPDYGGTYVSSFYYNGPMEDEPETEQATNKLQEMFGFERTAELESIFDFDRTHEPTNQEVQSIRKGMSYAEVIAIAGKPHGYYECGEFEDGDYTVFWCTQEGYEPCARWICFRLPDAYESEQERWSNAWVSDINAG